MKTPQTGDVVQLKSGGAPMTVVGAEGKVYILTCVSVGGLAQDVRCPRECFNFYYGPLTPAVRQQKL